VTGQQRSKEFAFLENMKLGPMVPVDKGEPIRVCNRVSQPRNVASKTCNDDDTTCNHLSHIEGASQAVSSHRELAQSRK
jgi:hypothetical protein